MKVTRLILWMLQTESRVLIRHRNWLLADVISLVELWWPGEGKKAEASQTFVGSKTEAPAAG